MNASADQLLSQLHRVVSELEGLTRAANGALAAEGAGLGERLTSALSAARSRIQAVERGLATGVTQGSKAADGYVREHAWQSVAIAAALAFALGTLAARHE